jgi:hypothetical protein
MQRMRSLMAGVVGVGVMASGASAQQAVQWRVEDGGNGHWYGLTPVAQRWPLASDTAQLAGGVLASLGSAAENSFVSDAFAGQILWIGARRSSANFNQFIWIDGTPFNFSSWMPGEPNTCNPCGQAEFVLMLQGMWDDTGLVVNGEPNNPGYRGLIEWSADCNNDGLVDHGQILGGELDDANGNGVPDCCDAGTSCIPCPGDITGNGVVDGVDLSLVLATWLTDGDQGKVNSDRNGDGIVNGLDLAIVLAGWGACP